MQSVFCSHSFISATENRKIQSPSNLKETFPHFSIVVDHKYEVKPKGGKMSCVTSGSFQIQFNKKIREAETWQGPQSRSETGIISTSPSAHFSFQNSLQFNNLTLHTARVNSSKFQGEKVFIWNNHGHFSPHSPTSSLMLMPLKGQLRMDAHFALLLHTIYSAFWI